MTLPISVILVTWNSAPVLPATLAALIAAEPAPAELIVIDNASSDRSAELVEDFARGAEHIPVVLIRNKANVGFAAGANAGIARAGQPEVFLLNPDLRLRPETLLVLHEALGSGHLDLAAVGPKLLRAAGDGLESTGLIDTTGIVMTRDGRHLDRGAGEPDRGQYNLEEEVFGISGAAVLFWREALRRSCVDGEVFDEDFFAFREDADLAWRLRGFGYRARYVPSAVAYHRRSVTPERRRRISAMVNCHSVKNRFLLRLHHADSGWLWHFGARSLLRDIVVVAACLTVERTSLPAFPWLVRNLRRHIRRRRQIMRRRVVPSADLRAWFAR
jgi:GT2 family glycosyltransferase